jgi:hypothetical protein
MTAHPHRPQRSHQTDTSAAAPHDDPPRVAAAVPIAVWRLDAPDDHAPDYHTPGAGFASRLATQLILIYTRRGQTVVDLDNNPHLRHAATTEGRSYLTITDLADLADKGGVNELNTPTQPPSLISLRWPRTTPIRGGQQIGRQTGQVAALLAACRQVMTGDASLVAAVHAGDPHRPDTTFADYERALRDAGKAAGLTHVLQIVAISALGDGDQYLYYATPDEADQLTAQAATQGSPVLHIDLLVFEVETGRHD